MKKEVYVSIDVESDGPIPGQNSMLSLGAAAYDDDGNLVDTFQVNINTLPGAAGDPSTMAWWASQTEAWNAHRQDTIDAPDAMLRFVDWVERLPGKPSCVAYPAGFDFMFVYWYMIKFAGRSPFSFSCIDIKTLAFAAQGGKTFKGTTKRNMPKRWFPKNLPHTHIAIDDAIEQGALFCNILQDVRRLK